MKNSPKCTTVDTTNLQPERLIHIDFSFCDVTCIQVFISILAVVCTKTITPWVFPNTSKRAPVRIIIFILTALNNEKHPCRLMKFDEDSALINSIDVTNLLVYDFIVAM